MDQADTWLAAHDPHHTVGAYDGPTRELSFGLAANLGRLVEHGACYVEHGAVAERACRICCKPFTPREGKNDLCSQVCRQSARRVYQRDLMRQRRAAA